MRPRLTTSGIGGCSSGCQSGTSELFRACVSVIPTVLFGTWKTVPSSLGPGTAAATGYAHPGIPGALVTAGAFCCCCCCACGTAKVTIVASAIVDAAIILTPASYFTAACPLCDLLSAGRRLHEIHVLLRLIETTFRLVPANLPVLVGVNARCQPVSYTHLRAH